jgi:hypothetical protein
MTSGMVRAGDYREYSVSGTRPALSARRMGLGGQRPDKLRASLAAHAERGNALQDVWRLDVLDRAVPGLKLRLSRLVDRGDGPAVVQDVGARWLGTGSGAVRDVRWGSSGREEGQLRTRFVRESARVDSSRDSSRDKRLETGREPLSANAERRTPGRLRTPRPDVDALHARGYRRVSAAQRRMLDEWADRHDETGPAWAAARIMEAPPDVDPLGYVLDADRRWQADQLAEAVREDAEWQATKRAEAADAAAFADRLREQGFDPAKVFGPRPPEEP